MNETIIQHDKYRMTECIETEEITHNKTQQKPNELKNGNSYQAVLWTINVYHFQTTNTCSKATSQTHRCHHLCQTDSSNTGHTTASHVWHTDSAVNMSSITIGELKTAAIYKQNKYFKSILSAGAGGS